MGSIAWVTPYRTALKLKAQSKTVPRRSPSEGNRRKVLLRLFDSRASKGVLREQEGGEAAEGLAAEGVVVFERLDRDLVGACLEVLLHSGLDGVLVAHDDEGVDE